MDNEDVGRPVSDYFGVSGDAAKVKSCLLGQLWSFLYQTCASKNSLLASN